MPRYTFECSECNTQFSKKLKMGEHPYHYCPNCGGQAVRAWEGQGFGFDFQEGKVPGNSGVTKHDYPTADQAVGRDAEKRWDVMRARDKVKEELRAESGTKALHRKHAVENGSHYTEYRPAGKKLMDARRKLVKVAENENWGVKDKKS